MKKDTHLVLAFYLFAPIDNPHQEVKLHQDFFASRDIKSRIYISEEGINGQMSGEKEDATAYVEWIRARSPFQEMPIKVHLHHENVFPKQTVKYRKQLVAIDTPVDMQKTGEHVSPKEWKEMLEEEERPLLIDVRNDYEWKIGHFEGSTLPNCKTFREFNDYAEELKKEHNPKKTRVMMCCTGGIRCELYSALLKEKGFEQVYQLDGGIINYGLKEGDEHWKGKLFVFDDRLAVPIAEENDTISHCQFCDKSSDQYYNCANMECNELFLACKECVQKQKGCCGSDCMEAPRMRPFDAEKAHKPFRKQHHYR